MTFDPRQTLGALGERALLRHLRARVPAVAGVVVGIGDDAAAVEIGPFALVTSDSLVEGVHFEREAAPPRLLGRKALTVNLSDIAAMGGLARYAVISLCLPTELEAGWVDSLYDGLLERAAEAGVGLVGGNITRSDGRVVVDVTLLGDAGRLLLRNGAKAGDRVVVTGALGAAAEGVRLLADGARIDEDGELVATGLWTGSSSSALVACLRAQLDPRPPLALARSIAERGLARAGMDLSDGLSTDLPEICGPSGLSAVIDARSLPVDARAAGLERARGSDPLDLALHGGEDYQLLLAVAPDDMADLTDLARVWGIEVSAIGEFCEDDGAGVRLRDETGERPLAPGGHDPFPELNDPRMGWLMRRLRLLLQVEGSPARVASAFAIGIFIAFFPLIGIHTGLALVVAIAFRLNKVAVLTGAWINNPWTLAPMYTLGTLVGCALLGVSPTSLGGVDWALSGRAFYDSFIAGFRPLLLPFLVGNLVTGLVAGLLTFVLVRSLLLRRRSAPPAADAA